MHRVNRDDNPKELKDLREELKKLQIERKEDFGSTHRFLSKIFDYVCAYCERGGNDVPPPSSKGKFQCDHFKPQSRFDHLRYDADNLVYACHECNGVKGDQWPDDTGYVDPCAKCYNQMPESIFRFDFESIADIDENVRRIVGISIRARDGLCQSIAYSANCTIDQLALNQPKDAEPSSAAARRSRKSGGNFVGYPGSDRRVSHLAKERYQRIQSLIEDIRKAGRVRDPQRLRDEFRRIRSEYTHRNASFSSMCDQFLRHPNRDAWIRQWRPTVPRSK